MSAVLQVEMVPVASSNIESVGYMETDTMRGFGTLQVKFASGAIWQYFGVGPLTYDQLLASGSVGRYFAEFIRDQYDSRNVTPQEDEDE